MFEAIGNAITGAFAVTSTLMILTFPTWLAGKIVAARTRALPVPFFYRLKLVRWASWYFTGIVGMTTVALALRPTGTFEVATRLVFVAVALVAYLATAGAAFYIGWTASAQRRARKARRDRSDPTPLVQGQFKQGASEGEDALRDLPTPGANDDTYVPAQPFTVAEKDGSTEGNTGYGPARPTEWEQER